MEQVSWLNLCSIFYASNILIWNHQPTMNTDRLKCSNKSRMLFYIEVTQWVFFVVYLELRNTRCVSFVVTSSSYVSFVDELATAKLTRRLFLISLQTTKKTHCVKYLLHVCTANHPGKDPVLGVKWQQNLQFSVTAFLRHASECARQGISPIFSAFTVKCIYVSSVIFYFYFYTIYFYWHWQTRDKEHS